MLKSIPKSDYTIRPFKAYKSWSLASGSSATLLDAENTNYYITSNDVTLSDGTIYNKHSIHGQLNSFFYANVDNPIFRVGTKSAEPASVSGERVYNDKAKVFYVPQSVFGEGIKKGSLTVTDTPSGIILTDNTSGSLMSGSIIVGDVFYGHGVITYTHTASVDNMFTGSWQLDFKSTKTIYEHEILLIANESEFNFSTNPSAYIHVGFETASFVTTDSQSVAVTTNPGVKYVRKRSVLSNGNVLDFRYGSSVSAGVSGGFEHYELSSSVDSTGSFLAPYITTIGLYDDDLDLVAIAKLPRPIKSEPDLSINFLIRFDT